MKTSRRFLVFLLCLLLLPVLSAAAQDSIAFQRARSLQHGINTSIWFAQRSSYPVEELETFTTLQDLTLIHNMGFDHIRLSIDPGPLEPWLYSGKPTPFLTELDKVVHAALADHLSVIVDIHPSDEFKATLFQGSGGVQHFAMLWSALAAHYAPVDPDHIFFEILNEPEQSDPYRWMGVQATLAAAIRHAAPQNTIIATAAHYSGVPDLLQLQPLADPNVIYTFHDYEPFPFTHQGATWTMPESRFEHGIPYPSTPENVAPELSEEPTLQGQLFIDQYGWDRWNAARIDDYVGYAEKWAQLHQVPVYCGEFGSYGLVAPPASRVQWIHDMRVALENHHIGWAMWDYQTPFGVVSKASGVTTPNLDVLKALGLHAPQP
ncbi:MAG TPA: cellulase family glycosylhydrolase [Acidobacteriaceae bacterium]|nr:cellulase family glycosylhydrolase [Acidobacteriaceae bacterium]